MFLFYNLFGEFMKIVKLKKIANNKYKIFFDNNDSLTTYDDVVIEKNILYKEEISELDVDEIKKNSLFFDVYNKAIKMIGIKLRSKREIEEFLEKQDLDKNLNKKIIKKLEDLRLINDIAFVKAFINDKFNLSNYGPLRIKKELFEHNINEETINRELEQITRDKVLEKLDRLIKKSLKNNKKSFKVLKEKILYSFINLGYEKEDILEILERVNINEDDLIKKEYEKIYSKLSKQYSGFTLKQKMKEKLYQKGFDMNSINKVLEDLF